MPSDQQEHAYPSGRSVYAQNRSLIEERVQKKYYEDFVKPENFRHYVQQMFSLYGDDFNLLTPADIEDIKLFAKFTFKRLLTSETCRFERAKIADPKDARFSEPLTGDHDLIHALVAYARSKGRTLTPAFVRADQNTPETMSEELFTMFIQSESSPDTHGFLQAVAACGDPLSDPKIVAELLGDKRLAGKIERRMRSYEHLRTSTQEKDRVLYFGHMVAEWWYRFGPIDSYKEKDTVDFLLTSKDPGYLSFLTMMYRNYSSAKADPLARFRWFQKVTGPLLTRLRKASAK